MKRAAVVLLGAALAMAGVLAACGGDDDDDDEYEFGGRWFATFTLASSNISGMDETGTDVLIISQDGNNITVKVEDVEEDGDALVMTGTCDPDAKTFSATGTYTEDSVTIRSDISGAGIDDDSMSGTWTLTASGVLVSYTWTADLTSRTLTVSSSRPGGGMVGVLRKLVR